MGLRKRVYEAGKHGFAVSVAVGCLAIIAALAVFNLLPEDQHS